MGCITPKEIIKKRNRTNKKRWDIRRRAWHRRLKPAQRSKLSSSDGFFSHTNKHIFEQEGRRETKKLGTVRTLFSMSCSLSEDAIVPLLPASQFQKSQISNPTFTTLAAHENPGFDERERADMLKKTWRKLGSPLPRPRKDRERERESE